MSETLSTRILREAAGPFEAMVNHRFVLDIEAGRLPPAVFDRYLLIEGAFVETAIAIFGYAVAKAETLAERRKMIGTLDALANEQMVYFETAFAARGIAPDPALQALPEVAAFREGMLAIARDGSYAQIITAMFAAEWMYWTWCARAAQAQLDDPLVRDWIDMHAAPAFAAQAAWLRDRIDALGAGMDEAARAGCVATFARVQELEIGFHAAAYADPSQSAISAA